MGEVLKEKKKITAEQIVMHPSRQEHSFKHKSEKCSWLKSPVKAFQVLFGIGMAQVLRVFIRA